MSSDLEEEALEAVPTAVRDACRPAKRASVDPSRWLRASVLPVEILAVGQARPDLSGAGADGDRRRLPCPAERGGGGRQTGLWRE